MTFDTQYDHAQDGGVLVLRKQIFSAYVMHQVLRLNYQSGLMT